MKTICKSRRARHVTHLYVHTHIHFIPCNILSKYKCTFVFTQLWAWRYLRRLSDSMIRTRKHNLCMTVFLYLCWVQLQTKLQMCPWVLYVVTTNIMRAMLYLSVYIPCRTSLPQPSSSSLLRRPQLTRSYLLRHWLA
jgi:hypothetical protein